MKDNRFDLSIEPEREAKLIAVTESLRLLANDRPLAVMKTCLDLQRELLLIEKEAAFRANGRFKVSWDRMSKALGRDRHWAWNRYCASGLSHPKSRRKLTELSPSEMKEQPKDEEAE